MSHALDPALFRLFAELVRKRTGVVLPPSRLPRVERRLAAEAHAAGGYAPLYRMLREMPTEHASFAHLLDAVETSTAFFRDPEGLLAVAEEVAPERLLASGAEGTLDVWCVGCATGEEVFSLAMLFQEKGLVPGRRVRLRGTDLSPDAIRRARLATYGPHTMRFLSDERRRLFFEPAGAGRFRVKEPLRSAAWFGARSLLDEPRGSGSYDVIICREVLASLEEDMRSRAVETLASFLKPGGYLLLGRTDGLAAAATPLTLVRLTHDVAYRR